MITVSLGNNKKIKYKGVVKHGRTYTFQQSVQAKLEDGVLTVTIPKNIQANVSRKIEIG